VDALDTGWRMVLEEAENLLGVARQVGRLGSVGSTIAVAVVAATDEHAVTVLTGVAIAQLALGEVQVDVGGLEHVVVDLVVVGNAADVVGVDEATVGEALDASVYADVCVLELDLLLVGRRLGVHPLLDIDLAGAIVDLVGDVRGERGDAADLANDGDLRDGVAINLEVGA
jgi:hypothetical protein